jgi:hypothetical protein
LVSEDKFIGPFLKNRDPRVVEMARRHLQSAININTKLLPDDTESDNYVTFEDLLKFEKGKMDELISGTIDLADLYNFAAQYVDDVLIDPADEAGYYPGELSEPISI